MKRSLSRPTVVLAGGALVFALLVTSATSPPAGHAAFPGANGKIAFTSARDGNCEVYLMNPDGSGLTRLTDGPAEDGTAAWSPDGTKIAFMSARDGNNEIYVMNADGSGQQRLTQNPALDFVPAWSPDGTRIAFTSARDGNREIYVMNADGSGQQRLTQDSAADSNPAWSPDGTTIGFTSNRDGNFDIYLMNADGSNARNLTQTSVEVNAQVDWSPDGTKLVLMRSVDPGSIYEVYGINADGSGLQNLSQRHGITPVWSPDGTKIAFTSGGIWVMNADGSGQTMLTGETGCDGFPSWQPIVLTPAADLTIEEVVPIQSVENPDINGDGQIDLVQDKPLVIRVKVQIQNADQLPAGQPIAVRLFLEGSELNQSRTVQQLQDNGFFVDFFSTPRTLGNATITARVDPENAITEVDEGNNDRVAHVTVKDTRGLSVAYLRVDCLGPLSTYDDTVTKAGEFLRALYPVSPSEVTNQRLDASVTCLGGLVRDSWMLWLEGKLLTFGKAERIVGIVDSTWANSRMPGANGVTWCGSSRAFVRDGRWDTVSHEIGHTFQFSHPGDPPDMWCAPRGPGLGSTKGFWVTQQTPIVGATSLMGPGGVAPPPFPVPNRWIARDDYERVFAEQFRLGGSDPEVLLVSGTVHRDGRIEFAPLYRLPSGVVDEADPGDFSVQILDATERILYERSFDLRFRIVTDPPMNVDAVPFGLAVPYPMEAAAVRIQRNGQTLASVSVTARLLQDAVALLPDAAFVENAAQRRNALLNKIDALDAQLASGNLNGARTKLRNDIRKHMVSWLRDDYATETPLEYSRQALLDLVDELLQRLVG